jgi:DNA-binding response OmpR family regulator
MQYRPSSSKALRSMFTDQHRRVLVTDADDELRDQFSALLRHKGLVVDEAADGRTAISLVRENAYSVVMLDVAADGLRVLDALDRAAADAPVVLVVTDGPGRPGVDHFDARRIHGLVKKPFDLEEIAGVIAACAEVRGRSAFETMMYATMMSGAPLIALLEL